MSKDLLDQDSIPQVIRNSEGLYEGDLVYYGRVFFQEASSLFNHYHNLRHTLHVVWLCYQACRYYRNYNDEFPLRKRRNLMIAALFHDFNHPGKAGDDSLNIKLAIGGLRKHILQEDLPYFDDIAALISFTEYPHQGETKELSLGGRIIRDADLMQTFSPAWIQQVFGLALELGKSPAEILSEQVKFLQGLKFTTDWARRTCPPPKILAKIRETEDMINIFIGE